jgi:hypothetical protein
MILIDGSMAASDPGRMKREIVEVRQIMTALVL